MSDTIRVIMFEEAGQWVAQCLEYDIAAQAPNLDSLNDRLEVTLKAELAESIERHGSPFAGINPAPERYQRMWDRRVKSFDVSANTKSVEGAPPLELALVA